MPRFDIPIIDLPDPEVAPHSVTVDTSKGPVRVRHRPSNLSVRLEMGVGTGPIVVRDYVRKPGWRRGGPKGWRRTWAFSGVEHGTDADRVRALMTDNIVGGDVTRLVWIVWELLITAAVIN